MALQYVVNLQDDLVLSDGNHVVVGDADPVVLPEPAWSGQSPGVIWQEWDPPVMCEMALSG
jgi:hypothetical protein